MDLVGHLAELDTRKLHLAEGYGSLFSYCTGALRLAEHAAYNRIEAARLCRRFPVILDLLADGSLNVSTARLLAPHLRPDNFESLVAQSRGRSKREVEALVARLAPRPDIEASVRRLPAPRAETAPPPAVAKRGHDSCGEIRRRRRLPKRLGPGDSPGAADAAAAGELRSHRTVTACSSPSGPRRTRSYAGSRISCGARFRTVTPVRSSIGR